MRGAAMGPRMQKRAQEFMTVILTIGAILTASMFLFSALLVVCRGFAMQNGGNHVPEPYEARLWLKYSAPLPAETKRAA